MRTYELVVIVRPSVKDADRKKLLETAKGWLKDVKFTKEEDWGQKPLAYTIKKEVAGNYSMWQFDSEEGVPADFERKLIRNEDVIRHLLLRTK
jgi:small subunit ribosomal protein S6